MEAWGLGQEFGEHGAGAFSENVSNKENVAGDFLFCRPENLGTHQIVRDFL